jgi:hypothetical protein
MMYKTRAYCIIGTQLWLTVILLAVSTVVDDFL